MTVLDKLRAFAEECEGGVSPEDARELLLHLTESETKANRRGGYIAALKQKGHEARAALLDRSMNPLRKIAAALEALKGFGPEGATTKESSDTAAPEGATKLGPGRSTTPDQTAAGPGATDPEPEKAEHCPECGAQFDWRIAAGCPKCDFEGK